MRDGAQPGQTELVAAIIPYFQREPGVLKKAVLSALAQKHVGPFPIVVVDDGSPVPASTELREIERLHGDRIRILEQDNGGPGAARNRGLKDLPSGTRYVALLDSDDEWTDEHLARAVLALSQGYDFYFADHFQLAQTVGAFARAGRIVPGEHPRLARGADLHAYAGDMFDQIITGNVIGTSTVVFDILRFPQMRFREDFRRAGEDYLCWIDFVIAGARIAFSTQREASYGRGVNVYSGAEWGTVQHLARVQDELKYRKATLRLYETTKNQRRFLKERIAELREAFVRDLAHLVRQRKPLPFRILREHLIIDPLTLLAPVTALRRRLANR